jgi:predicted DNA-binding transcriptional regulator AlpA
MVVHGEAAAAQILGVSQRTLQRWRQDGSGPRFVRLGLRRIGYSDTAICEFIETRTVASTSQNPRPADQLGK